MSSPPYLHLCLPEGYSSQVVIVAHGSRDHLHWGQTHIRVVGQPLGVVPSLRRKPRSKDIPSSHTR